MSLWQCRMVYGNTRNICITQQINIFHMTSARSFKLTLGLKKKKHKNHPLKVPNRPIYFNLQEYKFIDMISESTFQPLRNYYLMTFDFVSLMKSIQSYLKRLLKYSSLFQLHTCVKSIFLHIVKPRQCIVTDWIQKQIWLQSSLALEIWQNTKQWLSH